MASTIRDVAERARVSISTVSRVLNNTSPVSEEKRHRVEEAVESLGYIPNPAARTLLSQRTGAIGVLLPFIFGEFFSELLMGIDQSIQKNDHFLLVSSSHRSPTELKKVLCSFEKRVDGLVLMITGNEMNELLQMLPDIPVAFINTRVAEGQQYDVINFDNFGGYYHLTKEVLARGHRRIVLLKGPDGAHDAQERLRGFRAAIEEAGAADLEVHEFSSEYSREAGQRAVPQILALQPRPTVVMAPNDYCAMGVLWELRKAGLRVPTDFSLTGFDDVPSAAYTHPPLATVRVPLQTVGARAVGRVIGRIRHEVEGDADHVVLPAEVVLRDSLSTPT